MKPIWLLAALAALLALGGCTVTLPAATTDPLTMEVNGKTVTLPPKMSGERKWTAVGRGGEDYGGRTIFAFYNFKETSPGQIEAKYKVQTAEWQIEGVRQSARRENRRRCKPVEKTFTGSFNSAGSLVLETHQCGGAKVVLTPQADGSWNMEATVYRRSHNNVFNRTLWPDE